LAAEGINSSLETAKHGKKGRRRWARTHTLPRASTEHPKQYGGTERGLKYCTMERREIRANRT